MFLYISFLENEQPKAESSQTRDGPEGQGDRTKVRSKVTVSACACDTVAFKVSPSKAMNVL